MSTTITKMTTSSKYLPSHFQRDDINLELEKILSRVAEIRSHWSEEERATRRKVGQARRQQLMDLVSNEAA